MYRLTKDLLASFAFSLISLGLFISGTYLRDPQNFHLVGFSLLRTLTLTGLVLLCGFLLGAAITLRKNRDWEKRTILALENLIEMPWIGNAILSTCTAVIVIASLPLWNILILGDERFIGIIIRFLPFIFLTVAVSFQVIGSEFFSTHRRRWIAILFFSPLCTGMGIWLQSVLLSELNLVYTFRLIEERIIAQGLLALISLILVIFLSGLPKPERILWVLMVVMVAGLFFLQWMTFPRKLWKMKPSIATYAPYVVFGLPLLTKFLMDSWGWVVTKTHDRVKRIVQGGSIFMLILLAYIYNQGAVRHMREVNISKTFSDQSAYLNFIVEARRLNFNYTGDHNRMPAYPFLQALFYRSGMSDQELFEQGKQLNIILSLVFLGLLLLIFLKLVTFSQAVLLVLMVAFSLFIFKAPYIQSEIMFYSLSFICFVLMLEMLIRPAWIPAIVTGMVVGISYLTKGTILVSLISFVITYGFKQIVYGIQEFKKTNPSCLHEAGKRTGYLILILAVFFISVSPYTQVMKERFGQYFYNVNTTFYVWYDSWKQVVQEEAKHHFEERWPAHLPEDQLPSLRKYLREHTPQQIMERFRSGAVKVLNNIYRQYSVTNYTLSYLLILLIAILLDIGNGFRIAKRYPFLVIFSILFFGGYLVAFSWYAPISAGRRFTYGLYVPFLVIIFMMINQLAKNQSTDHTKRGYQVNLAEYFSSSNMIISITLLYNIWLVVTETLFYDRYGS